MATTSVIRTRKQPKMCIVTIPAADMDTDASGDIAITFPDLREVLCAQLQIGAGYVANLMSVATNIATFRVYDADYDAVGDGPLIAAASESNIATGFAIAWGY